MMFRTPSILGAPFRKTVRQAARLLAIITKKAPKLTVDRDQFVAEF